MCGSVRGMRHEPHPTRFALKKGVEPPVMPFPLTDTLFAIHGRSLMASLPLEGRLGETPSLPALRLIAQRWPGRECLSSVLYPTSNM